MQAQGPPPPAVPLSQVEISIAAKKLKNKDAMSKSDPMCIVYMKDAGQDYFYEAFRTEIMKDNLNPQWLKKFEVDYRFEERQLLKFSIYDWDNKSTKPEDQDFLGSTECSLGEIMSAPGSQLQKTVKGGGVLILTGEERSQSKEMVTLNFTGSDLDKKDFFGKSDPFLVFYRVNENNQYNPVHKTEIIKNTLNPVWKEMSIPARMLCSGDHNKMIKIECFDWDSDGSHDLIGECFTTLAALKEGAGPKNTYELINQKKKAKKSKYKNSGILTLQSCMVTVEPSFLDFIRGGTQLHFSVAVDFTASNGDPRTPDSLHFRQAGVDNQYTFAIRSVGEIIQDYDSDKQFPALGFGGRIPPTFDVSHEFFLNGTSDNPYCAGVEGILQAYHHSLGTVGLYGPTNFAPVIRHVGQFARTFQDGRNYFVLLIITDGIISDMAETRRAIVEVSSLPMSIIIVGVGNEDFTAMEQLDGDDKRVSADGRYAERDIVQFVEIRKYTGGTQLVGKAQLAQAILREIPHQLSAFMRTIK